MSDLEEKQLDALDTLMARHLSAELDRQLGRAEAAFLRHLVGGPSGGQAERAAGAKPAGPPARGPARRFRGWALTTLGTALAACAAGLWAGPLLFPNPTNPNSPAPSPVSPAAATPLAPDRPPMMHYVHSRTWDGGTVILGDQVPARRVFRQDVEHTRWYDSDQKAHIELTIPRHGVELMEVDTY